MENIEASAAALDRYNAVFFPMPRKERLKTNLFLVVYAAIARRIIGVLFQLHLVPGIWKTKTFFGETFYVKMPAGFVAWQFGFLEGFELALAKFIIANLKQGGVLVDAGANDGYFSLLASRIVGDSGKVYAFEPTPGNIPLLDRNFNGKSNIVFEKQALWEKSGSIDFIDFGLHGSGSNTSVSYDELVASRPELKGRPANHIQVPAITLDEYCEKNGVKPTFLQFDAEGGEFEILKGCEKILKTCKPIVCVEVWNGTLKGKYHDMEAFMNKCGYSVHWLAKDGGLSEQQEAGGETVVFMPK